MPSLLILVPFLGIIILNLPFKRLMRKVSFGLLAAIALFQMAIVALPPLAFRDFSHDPFISFFVIGVTIDNLALVALGAIGMVTFVCLLVVRAMLTQEVQRFNFINLMLLALLGMNVTVLANDIFSVYIFIEVTAISSFIFIALTRDRLAIEGAFKYIILSSIATVLLLSGIGLLLLFSPGTSFTALASTVTTSGDLFLCRLAVGLVLCGLLIKSGAVPFHGWLPDAYTAASAPASVLLAGIVTKISGVYVVLRLVISVVGGMAMVRELLMGIGLLSIVAGAFLALTQNNFKRLLAYSSISQVGYIILAAGCATPLAIVGAVFHFFNHALFKSLLFVNAAALEKQSGTQDMDKMAGVGHRMPVTGITSVIAFLSAAGIPPLAGFWSKLIIVMALWNAGNLVYASGALLASIVTLAYFLYVQRQVFWGPAPAAVAGEVTSSATGGPGTEGIGEVGFNLLLPQVLLAIGIVIVGVGAPWILQWR